jgi:hypothetical protein
MPGRLGVQRGRRSARLGGGYRAVVLGDAPLGYWRLDETSGTSMADSSGNGHTGTMTGSGFTLNQPGAIQNTDPGAKSVKWIATSTYVDIASASWMNVTNAATWELWINPGVNGNNAGILSRYANSDWLLWYNTSGLIEMRIVIAGAAKNLTINPPQLGVWSHIVATYNGTNLLIYVNGALTATLPQTGNIDTNSGNINIGTYQSGSFGLNNHYLDEVAFYGTALSAAKVLAHFNAGVGIY